MTIHQEPRTAARRRKVLVRPYAGAGAHKLPGQLISRSRLAALSTAPHDRLTTMTELGAQSFLPSSSYSCLN
jgi:hypothetical protein